MRTILVIGSNCGEKEAAIRKSLILLEKWGEIEESSGLYETPDCLGKGRPYMNAVISFITTLSESVLNQRIKDIEVEMGRDKEARKRGDVPIDIDIVVWEGEVKRLFDYNAGYFRLGMQKMQKKVLKV